MIKPLRIALIMQGDSNWMGGMEYIRNIILALATLPQEARDTFEITLLVTTQTDQDFISTVKPYVKTIYVVDELIKKSFSKRIKLAFERRILQKRIGTYDVFLENNNFDFVYPYTSSAGGYSPEKATAWIYDFQHKYLTSFFSVDEIIARDREFSQMIQKSPLIVFSSKAAETDFNKFYPESSVQTEVLAFKTIPQPQWYEADPKDIQNKYNLPDKFFIISNQFWQHKNHLAVFRALELLNTRGINPVVICTGRINDYRKPEYSDTILQSVHKLGLAKQVFLLGLIPKLDQIQLLRRSIALIQPSLFEGWSTVVEDARCMGKHVILSDFPVHLEQNPPHCRFFERSSDESLAGIIADYWQSLSPGPNVDQELIAKENSKKEVQGFASNFLKIAKDCQWKLQ